MFWGSEREEVGQWFVLGIGEGTGMYRDLMIPGEILCDNITGCIG